MKTTLLLGIMTGVLLFFGRLLGGNQGVVIAFIFAAGMNFFSYFFSDKIVLAMYRAKPITEAEAPRFYAAIARLAQKAGIPIPRVFIIPAATPNAFATGRNTKHAAVAATTSLLNLLSEEEIEAVMAHELSHARNRDILIGSIAATLAGAISMIASMVRWGAIFGGFGGRDERGGGMGDLMAAMIMAILAPIVALIIQMAVSRTREFQADASGAQLCGNPLALASALKKIARGVATHPMQPTPGHEATAHLFIANPFQGSGIVNLFSTHPSVEERVARLERMVYGY